MILQAVTYLVVLGDQQGQQDLKQELQKKLNHTFHPHPRVTGEVGERAAAWGSTGILPECGLAGYDRSD